MWPLATIFVDKHVNTATRATDSNMYRLAVLELIILQDYLNRTVSSPHEYYLTSI